MTSRRWDHGISSSLCTGLQDGNWCGAAHRTVAKGMGEGMRGGRWVVPVAVLEHPSAFQISVFHLSPICQKLVRSLMDKGDDQSKNSLFLPLEYSGCCRSWHYVMFLQVAAAPEECMCWCTSCLHGQNPNSVQARQSGLAPGAETITSPCSRCFLPGDSQETDVRGIITSAAQPQAKFWVLTNLTNP